MFLHSNYLVLFGLHNFVLLGQQKLFASNVISFPWKYVPVHTVHMVCLACIFKVESLYNDDTTPTCFFCCLVNLIHLVGGVHGVTLRFVDRHYRGVNFLKAYFGRIFLYVFFTFSFAKCSNSLYGFFLFFSQN